MGGSNPISKAAGWATKQAGGGVVGKIVGGVINNDPLVRLSQGKTGFNQIIQGKPADYWSSSLMGKEGTPQAPVTISNPYASGDPMSIAGSAGGAGQTDVDGAQLYNRYINNVAMNDYASGRSGNTQALLAQAMDMSKGLGGKEMSALRSNALSQVNQQNQAALGDLRGQMASQGVRGGLAAAMNAQQQGKAVEAVSGAERNLVADNVNYKTQGLQNAAMLNTNQENIERDMMRGKLETILTMRGQNMGLAGAQMQAQAAANAPKGGKK